MLTMMAKQALSLFGPRDLSTLQEGQQHKGEQDSTA